MHDLLGGFKSKIYINLLWFNTLIGIIGVVLCYHAARVLKSFEEESFSFQKMSNSFQWIGYTLLTGLILYNVLRYYLLGSINTSFWADSLDGFLTMGILGFFFLAISQIIKKADYYKSQNDLTI
jgi:hypothetical protein